MAPISIPQATFQFFSETYPLLIAKLIRWASSREFPEDLPVLRRRGDPVRSREEFVERYVHDFLINPPATVAGGTALMGAWAHLLDNRERHQISRLFGCSFEFTSPDHWYTNDKDEYLVLTEPVLEIYRCGAGVGIDSYLGAKTLNAYNAQILNCDRMLIVDVDLKEDGTDKCVVALSEEMALTVLTAISRGTKYQWRVYRTAGGLRYLEVSRPWRPESQATQRLMSLLYADPLYMLLCRKQETFRARLTPKPWRSDLVGITRDYSDDYFVPAAGGQDEAVCELIQTIGAKTVLKDFRELVEVHDSATKALPKYRSRDATYTLT